MSMSDKVIDNYKSQMKFIDSLYYDKRINKKLCLELKQKALDDLNNIFKGIHINFGYALYKIELAHFQLEHFNNLGKAYKLCMEAYGGLLKLKSYNDPIYRLMLEALKMIDYAADKFHDRKRFDKLDTRRKIYQLSRRVYRNEDVKDDYVAMVNYLHVIDELKKRNSDPEIHQQIIDEIDKMSKTDDIHLLENFARILTNINEPEMSARVHELRALRIKLLKVWHEWQEIDKAEEWCAGIGGKWWDDSKYMKEISDLEKQIEDYKIKGE